MFQQVRGKWEITAASGSLGLDRCVLGWCRAEPQFLCGGRGGGSGPDGVRSGHSWGGGRAARRAGQAGRPCHTTQRVDRQRARRIAQMSRGCRSLRTASNRMVCAVHAGEDGGLADVHSVPSLALNDHPQRRNHPSPSCEITVFSAVPMCNRTLNIFKSSLQAGYPRNPELNSHLYQSVQ